MFCVDVTHNIRKGVYFTGTVEVWRLYEHTAGLYNPKMLLFLFLLTVRVRFYGKLH
jgi:hypothetical protein